mgnify:CR=1 FL=1
MTLSYLDFSSESWAAKWTTSEIEHKWCQSGKFVIIDLDKIVNTAFIFRQVFQKKFCSIGFGHGFMNFWTVVNVAGMTVADCSNTNGIFVESRIKSFKLFNQRQASSIDLSSGHRAGNKGDQAQSFYKHFYFFLWTVVSTTLEMNVLYNNRIYTWIYVIHYF